jgi:putative peptidoglycan lipid II flippase
MGKEGPATGEDLRPDDLEVLPPEDAGDEPAEPEPRAEPGEVEAVSTTQAGQERLLKSTAVMSVGTALSRLTGFGRLAAMTYALGVSESRLADAYNIANVTPNMIYDLVLGGIIASVFVPVFVEWLEEHGQQEAWRVARAVLTLTAVIGGVVTVAAILAAPWIISLYTSRFTGPEAEAARRLATFFLRWFLPQILLYGLGAGIMSGLLNAHRRFGAPMFAPILNNLVVIATFVAFAIVHDRALPTVDGLSTGERYLLAVGTTAGVAAMTLALIPSLRRLGFRWRPSFEWRHPAVRRMGKLASWQMLYVVVNQIGLLIVIVLAAKVQGAYTAYAAAFIFFQLPYGIFAVSIMTALLPTLSSLWVDDDRDGFRTQLATGIRATAFIVLPAAAGYIALAGPITRLLLEHGATTRRSADLVAGVLAVFAVGMFSFSAFQLLLRAFYAMQDTRTPAFINVAAVTVNTGANLVLFTAFGVRGLALGHALAYTFAAVVAAVVIRRRMGGLEGRRLAGGMLRIGAAATATGGAAWAAATAVGAAIGTTGVLHQLVQVAAGVLAGLTIFLVGVVLLKVEEFDLVKRFILARVRR